MPYTKKISLVDPNTNYVHNEDHNHWYSLGTKLSYQYIYKKAFDVVMKLWYIINPICFCLLLKWIQYLYFLNYSYIYILWISFCIGNYSRRSSNPFRSDIDRSWFDMVYALLVPGRVNISISKTLSYPAFGLVFCSYTINGGLRDICCNVFNSMLLLRLSLNKSSNLVLFDPQLLWGTKDEIQ